jgi:nucleoside-triphosphatase
MNTVPKRFVLLMRKTPELSEIWIKASIVGTIWAASEIVLGSFLHNLHVPFSGNILTAIGMVILISVSHIWKEKGIFWRAGLICAAMKTMSPSAVIFGPMIAIISEAALLEFSTLFLGRNAIGYLIGSSLAMSWNLFQRIVNFIIIYGFNMLELYTNLINFAEKQFHLQFNALWWPIFLLLALYILFGLFTGILGIRVGKLLANQSAEFTYSRIRNQFSEKNNKPKDEFNYSITWLLMDVILIISLLTMLNYVSWYICIFLIAATVIIWTLRYKRALRQLKKPKFGISFIVITMVTAFVFTRLQSTPQPVWNGLIIGIQMNLRATVIIVGFSVLGTELYNPRIRSFFNKTYFRQLPLALELSFDSLPSLIGNIPDFKSVIRNPVHMLYQVITQAECRFEEIKNQPDFSQHIFIITGSVGEGKTTFLLQVIEVLHEGNIRTAGIYSKRVMDNNKTVGYNIVNIKSGEEETFLRQDSKRKQQTIGQFTIILEGFRKGLTALKPENNSEADVVIIDEVGRLELSGEGWAKAIEDLIRTSQNHLILVVRDSFVNQVIETWGFENYTTFCISETDPLSVGKMIMEKMKKSHL